MGRGRLARTSRRARPMAAEKLSRDADAWASLVSDEVGKPRLEAMAGDVVPSLDAIRWTVRQAGAALADRRIGPGWQRALLMPAGRCRWVPYGVVGMLGTWNYPIFLNAPLIARRRTGQRATANWSGGRRNRAAMCGEKLRSSLREAGVPERSGGGHPGGAGGRPCPGGIIRLIRSCSLAESRGAGMCSVPPAPGASLRWRSSRGSTRRSSCPMRRSRRRSREPVLGAFVGCGRDDAWPVEAGVCRRRRPALGRRPRRRGAAVAGRRPVAARNRPRADDRTGGTSTAPRDGRGRLGAGGIRGNGRATDRRRGVVLPAHGPSRRYIPIPRRPSPAPFGPVVIVRGVGSADEAIAAITAQPLPRAWRRASGAAMSGRRPRSGDDSMRDRSPSTTPSRRQATPRPRLAAGEGERLWSHQGRHRPPRIRPAPGRLRPTPRRLAAPALPLPGHPVFARFPLRLSVVVPPTRLSRCTVFARYSLAERDRYRLISGSDWRVRRPRRAGRRWPASYPLRPDSTATTSSYAADGVRDIARSNVVSRPMMRHLVTIKERVMRPANPDLLAGPPGTGRAIEKTRGIADPHSKVLGDGHDRAGRFLRHGRCAGSAPAPTTRSRTEDRRHARIRPRGDPVPSGATPTTKYRKKADAPSNTTSPASMGPSAPSPVRTGITTTRASLQVRLLRDAPLLVRGQVRLGDRLAQLLPPDRARQRQDGDGLQHVRRPLHARSSAVTATPTSATSSTTALSRPACGTASTRPPLDFDKGAKPPRREDTE